MKKAILSITLASIILLCSCGSRLDEPLPSNASAFEYATFENPVDPNDTYNSISYNGRCYIPYGSGKNSDSEYGECLGYIVQDGEEKPDERVYPINDDPDGNYLVIIDKGFMSQHYYLRDISTKGKNIYTPDFITDLEYDYWK